MEVIITVVGTLASVASAIFAWRQAETARDSANKAEEIRTQLISHRKTSELSELKVALGKAQTAMTKYGPASAKSSLQGVNQARDASDVQDFLLSLKENRNLFQRNGINSADILCTRLYELIATFSSATTSSNKKEAGTELLEAINSFSPVVKQALDSRKEGV